MKEYTKPTIDIIFVKCSLLNGSNEQGWNSGDGNITPVDDGWTDNPD